MQITCEILKLNDKLDFLTASHHWLGGGPLRNRLGYLSVRAGIIILGPI